MTKISDLRTTDKVVFNVNGEEHFINMFKAITFKDLIGIDNKEIQNGNIEEQIKFLSRIITSRSFEDEINLDNVASLPVDIITKLIQNMDLTKKK